MPEVYGGAEQQTFRQAKALSALGHEVTILTARSSLSSPARERWDGVKVRRHWTIAPPDKLGRWVFFSAIWIVQIVIFAIQHRNEYDIIHCHQGKFGICIAAILGRIWKVPLCVKIGNSGDALDIRALSRKRVFGRVSLAFALKQYPVFIAISERIAKDLKDFGIDDGHIVNITNGIAPIELPAWRGNSEIMNFFSHGRFESIKNIPLMLRAFAKLHTIYPTTRLTLIGSGSQETALRALTKDLQIKHAVTFLEPTDAILDTIASYDIYVNSSDAEGMSNAMLEALASGKALVSTPVSGTAEIIDDGKNGYVAQDHSIDALCSAMERTLHLVQQEGESVYQYSTKKAKTEFASDKIAVQIDALYKDLTQ